MTPGRIPDDTEARPVDPIAADADALRRHPFVLELWRRHGRVLVFGDRADPRSPLFRAISGDELWIDRLDAGLYECWFSERGERRLLWRTDSLDAVIAQLTLASSTARANELAPGCPFHDAPGDVRVETPTTERTIVSWDAPDAEHWIEFAGPLATGLEFAIMLRTPQDALRRRALHAVRLGGGHGIRGRCGPQPPFDVTVERLEAWRATDPPCTWAGRRDRRGPVEVTRTAGQIG